MAQQKVDEAEALDIKWGLFDDTPAKVTEEIKKARPRIAKPAASTAANQPHDRRTARDKLREARAALGNRQFEQAEAIALDVKGWGLTYGLFEDNPDKVAAAARALRRATRSATRHPASSRARVFTTSWCRSRASSCRSASSTRPKPRRGWPSG